jgi:hypothetical protein
MESPACYLRLGLVDYKQMCQVDNTRRFDVHQDLLFKQAGPLSAED